jgi:hypothetical protein
MKRLLEDSHLSSSLRDDLRRARAAGHDYPATAKLLQLRAAISTRAAEPQGLLREPGLSALTKPAQQLAWKLAALAAVGSGAVFLALPQPRPIADSPHAVAPPPSPATMQPTAETPPSDTATRAARLAVNATQQTTPLPPSSAGTRVAGTASTAATAQPAAPLPPFAAASAGARAATAATTTSTASAPPASVVLGRPHATSVVSPPSAAASGSSSSRREIAQLVRIRRLLERDPSAAYRLTVRSEREFPDGLLSEERGALAIVALAKLGSKQLAERTAQRYIARYPHSPMRALIEAALHH